MTSYNRRHNGRIHRQLTVESNGRQGHLLDLSQSGARLLLSQPGRWVALTFELDGRQVEVQAERTWIRRLGPGPQRMVGVRFVGLSAEARGVLHMWLVRQQYQQRLAS